MSTKEFIPSPFQSVVFDDIANGTGHTCIRAVAGSGKTTTIEKGLKYVPTYIQRRRGGVGFMAFNNTITDALKKRAPAWVEVRGLHSYGSSAVRRAFAPGGADLPLNEFRVSDMARKLSVELDKNAELRADVVDCVEKAKGMLASTAEEIDAVIDEFGYHTAFNGAREGFIATVRELLDMCQATDPKSGGLVGNCIDFNDMIWLPIVRNLRQWQYDRVFVDEVQDLNAAQIELALRAVRPGGRICAVGDPKQAIYKFRGADEFAFTNVVQRLGAQVLPLSVCYRCAKSIVRVAQEIVPDIQAAPDAEEGEVLYPSYKEMRKSVEPGDFVLSRSNAPLVALCMSLLAEGRPAFIQGRDVGKHLVGLVRKANAASVEELRTYVEEWQRKECQRLAEKRRDTKAVTDKVDCIMAISEGVASVADVIRRIEALFGETNDRQRIVLSSTHKAKGLERDRVWVLADTYRRHPDPEEDNLWYVAVTRARRSLMLVEGLR